MANRKMMLLLGAVCILLIVVGCINLNWGQNTPSNTPENVTPNNSTAGDNTETPIENDTNSTETEVPSNSTEPTEVNPDNTEPPINSNTSPSTTEPDIPNNPPPSEPDNPPDNTDNNPSNPTKPETPQPNQVDHEDDEDYTWDSSNVTTITLNTDSINVDNENGAIIDGTTVTITSAGTYSISGTLTDGQIIVDTNDVETVKLILNGVNISSSTNAPVYVEDAKKTVIILADNTENHLTDATNNEDNGTLASRDALTICGNGSLTVHGNANDAIRSNDGLIIKSGNITVTSVDDGVRGKDYLVIKGGAITVNSVGDGLKSDNNEEEDRGYISIEGGTIKVTSTEGDAISAYTDLLVTGGTFTLTSGGGSTAQPNDDASTKGLKAGLFIVIDGGDFTINSCDDAIHSNHKIFINDGTYNIATGDDGIRAETSIDINSGTVDITKSYEGLESKNITINGGHVELVAVDDGFNAVNTTHVATQGGGGWGGGWDGGAFGPPGEFYVYINGGFIYVEAGGDGVDTNGHIVMTDGVLIVNGPTDSMNGAIDYGEGTFKLTGGILVAAGSSGMAQAPTKSSTQYSVLINFRSQQPARKLVNIQNASGETVLTFSPTKDYQSIVFSSPELAKGAYNVYLGGTSTGTSSYGIYEDGTYTQGTLYTDFTISEITTTVGNGGGWWGW